ncbi:GMC family oxidoreductase N-terminal domain-containing protein [Dietzia sp.]|uniref:GMC family oxidoreductase N-terminal domain-containing protein n=1 Tax=Dietzia sp. TaxID=1871616 RepID=UPI002FDB8B30
MGDSAAWDAIAADAIVVGAGPAGAVAARRLAEAGLDVLALEAGPDLRAHPAAPLPAWRLPLWEEENGGAVSPARRIPADDGAAGAGVAQVWRGRGPGGSAAINGAAWTPADPRALERWPGSEGEGWPERYARGLERAEATMRPVAVPASTLAGALADALGRPLEPGRLTIASEAGQQSGSQASLGTSPEGSRRNPWTAYAPESAGARLRCGARVRSLLLSGGGRPRVGGVLLDDGSRLIAQSVVLAAGAIDTARLLRAAAAELEDRRLGGPAELLAAAGTNAREHPEILVDVPAALAAELRRPDPPGILCGRIPLDIAGRRLEVRPYEVPFDVAVAGPTVGASSGLSAGVPAGPLADSGVPLQVGVALLDPRSASVVDERAVRLSDRPDASDAVALGAGAEAIGAALVEIAGLRGMERRGPGGGELRRHRGYSQHLYGTAPMGITTDVEGRVPGLEGLRIVDASVIPTGPGLGIGAGPYASVLAVAEELSTQLAGELAG